MLERTRRISPVATESTPGKMVKNTQVIGRMVFSMVKVSRNFLRLMDWRPYSMESGTKGCPMVMGFANTLMEAFTKAYGWMGSLMAMGKRP